MKFKSKSQDTNILYCFVDTNSQFRTKISDMQEEITHMQQVFLSGESNLLKTWMSACINQINRDVLQFLCLTKHTLQVHKTISFLIEGLELRISKFLHLLELLFPCVVP